MKICSPGKFHSSTQARIIVIILAVLINILTFDSCKKEDSASHERARAIEDYEKNYLGSAIADPGWTGDVSSCNAGISPQATHEKVIKRINYFRRLVGLNDNTTLDASKFPMYQQAALMMKANNQLSHNPPNTWTCWTQNGFDGAQSSNLSLGSHSVNSITAFMADNGSNSFTAGHRRWILHSAKTQFSYGTTDVSMSLGVIGTAGGNTKIPKYIAYPPNGYIPQTLVFSRWSFGIPGADFSNAAVTMNGPDGNIAVKVVSKTDNGYGDNTIVWEPAGVIINSTADMIYTITISGIGGAAENSSYTYTTTIIKP
jgi:hypothetical protein